MSSENQTKNVEIGNTPNENATVEKPKSEWEQMLETMMRRVYLNGLSTGMKTMCGSILSKMNEFQNQRMNPQTQLIQLRKWCNQCLAKVKEPPKAEASTETENKVENQEEGEWLMRKARVQNILTENEKIIGKFKSFWRTNE